MSNQKFQLGDEVVRIKGDYVVGRIGDIIAIDEIKLRAQVKWKGETTTWVSFKVIEHTSVPYEIVPGHYNSSGKHIYSKYIRK